MPLPKRSSLVCLALLVAVLAYAPSAFAAPAVKKKHSPGKVTFVILIQPKRSGLTTWGTVFFRKGRCYNVTCGFRLEPGRTFRFTERPLNHRKHPFKYWVLPNGKRNKHTSVSVRVSGPSRIEAFYR